MNEKMIARKLTHDARDLLLRHINGQYEVAFGERHATRITLVNLGLVQPERAHRPTRTMITDKGRLVLSTILANYADALVRAGYLNAVPITLVPLAESAADFSPVTQAALTDA